MNRQAQAVVLLLLGGAVLKASFTDLYLRYVKEGLRPFLIAAALVLVVAAVMTLWYDLRPAATAEPDEDHGHDHGHGHGTGGGHHEPRVGWLLILPVLGLLLIAPPALGSYAAGQAGTALASQQVSDYPPLPDGDPVRVAMLDYASRALFDKGQSIGDRRVVLTGFVAGGGPGGEPILARMILSCCAADGRPIKLGMAGNAPTGLAEDTWIEVTGRYSDRVAKDPVNEADIPYVTVESWREVPVPKQQYE
ncbi:TIGR03943 family putative permease subunit [Micromonospora echinofusca]|uniref:TIGR03943 family protein n=1 Tax=Micromonospora echinofusca TaxID=47858 RepID=A0ABS3VUC9_MICEH|nr:TIGR03943 family protein [Micromonospora echinofusca]MBO4208142.1 TIGR03943 family protein [Micromonospora echinofusca]